MTASKSEAISRLTELVTDELDECQAVVLEVSRALEVVEHSPEGVFVAVAIAAYIENVFSGLERIMLRIADDIDGERPIGDSWHKDLLQRSGQTMGWRGPILTHETIIMIDEWRRFRHLVRHNYLTRRKSNEVEMLGFRVVTGFPKVRADVTRFLATLTGTD